MSMFEGIDYVQAAACCNCDKEGECIVIRTEAFTAPHCAKCLMRETKKRKNANGNGKLAEATLFDRGNPDRQ